MQNEKKNQHLNATNLKKYTIWYLIIFYSEHFKIRILSVE